MPGGYVNITDNADPMDIMVYRTAAHPTELVRLHGRRRRVALPRQVCRVPIFSKGSSADENSMISAGRIDDRREQLRLHGPRLATQDSVTTPGFVRVDLNRSGIGCHRVWLNTTDSAPTVVSKSRSPTASSTRTRPTRTATGTGPRSTSAPGSSSTRSYAGNGLGYNNNYAGISISPSGTEYLGTLGGIIALRDGG